MPVSYLSKKASPYLRVAAIIVIAGLVIFTGVRFYSWQAFGTNTRLITLVNPWNPVSETGYSAKLTETEDGKQIDRACADALRRMLADCRAAGNSPVLLDAYRSVDDQLVLHDARVQDLVDEGKTPEQAEAEVSRVIAAAGRSEHELGLAVDLADPSLPDEEQAGSDMHLWLRDNAWRHGFIQRYPEGKSAATGVDYVPGHYRFVGREAAQQIWELGLTLDEYIDLFYPE